MYIMYNYTIGIIIQRSHAHTIKQDLLLCIYTSNPMKLVKRVKTDSIEQKLLISTYKSQLVLPQYKQQLPHNYFNYSGSDKH